MPKNPNVKRVMVIGSGPIVIGQAAEFDYAGTQACRSLKEEGVEVILVNSNPATIMTDRDIADKVYIEPLTVKALEQIIEKRSLTASCQPWGPGGAEPGDGTGGIRFSGIPRRDPSGHHRCHHPQCGGTSGVQGSDGAHRGAPVRPPRW